MNFTFEPLEGIADSLYVKVAGAWNTSDMLVLAENMAKAHPTYLVVDTSDVILHPEQTLSVDETDDKRRRSIQIMVGLMQENPHMLYIIITPNDSPVVKTAKPLYEELGMGDRYLFVNNKARALQIIKEHQGS